MILWMTIHDLSQFRKALGIVMMTEQLFAPRLQPFPGGWPRRFIGAMFWLTVGFRVSTVLQTAVVLAVKMCYGFCVSRSEMPSWLWPW